MTSDIIDMTGLYTSDHWIIIQRYEIESILNYLGNLPDSETNLRIIKHLHLAMIEGGADDLVAFEANRNADGVLQ
jgi:hypothetical protein